MAEVKYEFTGDNASATAAIASLERKYEQLENKIRGVSRTSRRGAQQGSAAVQATTNAVRGLVLQYGSAAFAVQGLVGAYKDWSAQISEVAERLGESNRQLTDQIALTGDLSAAPELQQFFQGLPGVTQAQAQQVFTAVSGAGPGLPRARRQDITAAVSPLQGVLTPENVANVGAVAANLGEILPGRSAQDLAGLAFEISGQAGRNAPELQARSFEGALRSLRGRGISTEESLAFLTAGVRAGARSATLGNIAGRLQEGQTIEDLFAGNVDLSEEQRIALSREGFDIQAVREIQRSLTDVAGQNIVGRARANAAQVNAAGLVQQEALAAEEDTLQVQATQLDTLRASQASRLSRVSNPLVRFLLQGAGPLPGLEDVERGFVDTGLLENEFIQGGLNVSGGGIAQQTARGGADSAALERIANATEQMAGQQQLNRNAQIEPIEQ